MSKSTKKTKPVSLDIVSDVEIRVHPLPATEATDEFLTVGRQLDDSGALALLVGGGDGIRFDIQAWDMADAALMLKTLMTAMGEQSAGDMLLSVYQRYGVEAKVSGSWVALDTVDAMNEHLDAATMNVVMWQCLWGSLAPFFTLLESNARAKAEKQAQRSTESVETT